MSRITRCNRCGAEAEIKAGDKSFRGNTTTPQDVIRRIASGMGDLKAWRSVSIVGFPQVENVRPDEERYDLCEDCVEVFLLQFMKGAEVAAVTKPAHMTALPHDPYQDCLLAWDPRAGGFICEHDDPARFKTLYTDRIQNVAEGVPELQAKIGEVAEEMHTSGWAHSTVQRCSAACSEAHTYVEGCILAGVVQPADQPRRFTPCRYCNCTEHLGLRCSSTGCHCLVSTDGEELTAAYSPQEPAGE